MIDLKREYAYMKGDMDSALQRCLMHQNWILGPEVKELEDKISQYLNVRHCAGVSSGTDALLLSLRALAFKKKNQEYFDSQDLVITTPFTFVATAEAILRARATPVFIDIDPVTYNINTDQIRGFLRSDRKSSVVALLPVHLYGLAADMGQIMALAEEYGLSVIEDTAQAFGGKWEGKILGSFGLLGAFSFFPSKNLGAFGDAGMVATDDGLVAEMVRKLLKHGGKDKYNSEYTGYNARLDTIQASILLAKLKYVDEFNARRRHIAEIYNHGLSDIGGIVLPKEPSPACHVYHQYTIRVSGGSRDKLKDYLGNAGISSMVYYPVPLHKMDAFRNRCVIAGPLTESEKAAEEVLSLPIEPLMEEKEVDIVINAIKNWVNSL